MANFMHAIGGLLDREGGYVKDRDDGGGETKYGISKLAYPHLDIAGLMKQDAIDIYHIDYWDALACGSFVSQRVANVVFDFGVNAGVKRSAKVLQQCLGVRVDGWIGPITIKAVNDMDGDTLAYKFSLKRVAYYTAIAARSKRQLKFLVGWLNRVRDALEN